MYSSRGNSAYGQQPYGGQSGYGQNLGSAYSGSTVGRPDVGSQRSLASWHSSMLSGSKDADVGGYRGSAANYGGQYGAIYVSAAMTGAQQAPTLSAQVTRPSALEGRGGYTSALPDSPKFGSGDYVPSSSHGYGHKSDQLYSEKLHDYSAIDRRKYGEGQSAYSGRDVQSDPAARYADSVGFSHQHQDFITSTSHINLRDILDNKLIGSNYSDWIRQVRIVLRAEKIHYVLDQDPPLFPFDDAIDEIKSIYRKYMEDSETATCVMLGAMSSEFQKRYEKMDARSIFLHLEKFYASQTRSEQYEIARALFSCKMVEGTSAAAHALKMYGYIEHLGRLGYVMDNDLYIDLILFSLASSFEPFVLNFNMNKIQVSIPELINMLKTADGSLKKDPKSVMVVSSAHKGKKQKKAIKTQPKHSGIFKKKAAKKEKNPKGTCFHCGNDGHWKRNCKVYLDSLKEKKQAEASISEAVKDS